MFEDKFIAIDLGVDLRKCFQRADRCLDEERHETQLDPISFLKLFIVSFAYIHYGAHVDLVEGRQHCGGLGSLQQSFRNSTTPARHTDSLFPLAGWSNARSRLRL